jgi:hypothetical protein
MLTFLYHVAVGTSSILGAIAGIMAIGWFAITFHDHGADIEQLRRQLNGAWSEIRDLRRRVLRDEGTTDTK